MQDKVKVLKIVTVSIIIFIVLLFGALTINLVKLAKANSRENYLKKELAAKEAQYAEGEQQIELKQTREYIVRYAREHLNMKGKGETAFTGE